MKFRSESRLTQPRDQVFAAYRDRLPEVVPYLDDIAAIRTLSRREEGSRVILHNEWESKREVPAVAASIIKPDQLKWDDHATWDADRQVCTFTIKTRVFSENVRCTGTNTFLVDGTGTKVVLEGDFDISLKDVPGVPRFLAGTIAPQVEKFILALVQPNLEKVSAAVGRFLTAQG